jgi:hypothetical protein
VSISASHSYTFNPDWILSVFVFGTVYFFGNVVFLCRTPTFNPMPFLYESRFLILSRIIVLEELLGSFASIISEFVMNRSLLNTICATAFKLAVTVSSVISINSISLSFVDVVSS